MLPPRLPDSGRRNRALYRWLNALRDHISTQNPIHSVGTITEQTAVGVTRKAAPAAGTTEAVVEVARFQITGVAADRLTARRYAEDSTLGATLYTIARPPLLRSGTPAARGDFTYAYSGVNERTRTAAEETTGYRASVQVTGRYSWIERLDPEYLTGDVIYAAEATTGLAGVAWIDMNVDGRHWAVVPFATGICVDREAYSVMIDRSGTI